MNESQLFKCECSYCGNRIEFSREASNATITCPHCGQQTQLKIALLENPAYVNPPGRPKARMVMWSALVIGLAIVASGVCVLVVQRKPPVATQVTPTDSTSTPQQTLSPPGRMTSTQFTNFTVRAVKVEKPKGSQLIYATGKIKNDSSRQRFGVKVELDLFDKAGTKVGAAQDYLPILEPKREWEFRALVTEAKAVKAVVVSIQEQ